MSWLKTLTPRKILFAFVALNLLLGLFIAPDYGESTDEAFERISGGLALSMYGYHGAEDPVDLYNSIGNKLWYGTAQTMLFRWAEKSIGEPLGLPYLAISHYTYFITFQITVVVLFFFLLQFIDEWAALFTSILFGTQPLLFGHAFINPKDIPLLMIFLLTVSVGFKMVERLEPTLPPDAGWLWSFWQAVKNRYAELRAAPPKILKIAAWVLGGLLLLKLVLPPLIAWAVTFAYNAGDTNALGRLFLRFSGQAGGVPVSSYISKAQTLVHRGLNLGIIAVLLLAFVLFVSRLKLTFDGSWFKTTFRQIKSLTLKDYSFIFLAGAVWGFALATRVVAIAAGGMVGLYLLIKLRGRSIYPGLLYLLPAAVVCYLAWPYLWYFGFNGFLESLREFSAFQWTGMVMFEGQVYTEGILPNYFLPKLILLQFTLPLVVLAVGGMLLSVVYAVRRKLNRAKVFLLFAWFALPLAYTIMRHSVNYNNFRQYLFITVPLFVFAGLALAWLLEKKSSQVIRIALVVLVLLPGVIALFQLHPYQYIYYNELTGGVKGAFRQYELDYWLTSYKEAAEYIENNVPAGSSILVWGGGRRIEPYVTHDYTFASALLIDPTTWDDYEYIVITSEYNLDLENHLDAKTLFTAEVHGIPLVYVKQNLP